MKSKAYGWLAAAALAAGLNSSYHDGGLRWLHDAAAKVEHNSAAVIALASGHANQFLAEAQLASGQIVAERQETARCPWSRAIARVQAKLSHAESGTDHVESMSAREEARVARMEANESRMEARIAAKADRFRVTATAFDGMPVAAAEALAHCRDLQLQAVQLRTTQFESLHDETLRIPAGLGQTIRVHIPKPPTLGIPPVHFD
jgi:hypothetical protein